MASKNYKKSPLLYIHQPKLNSPEASMQSTYRSERKVENKTSKAVNFSHKNSFKRRRRNIYEEEMYNEEESVVNDKDRSDERSFKRMNLEEKIAYLTTQFKHIPKIRCEIKTNKSTYKGTITEAQDEFILIQSGNSYRTTKVPVQEITNIQMLGF